MNKVLLTIMCIGSFITANAQNFKLTVNLEPTETAKKYYVYHTDGNNLNDIEAHVDSMDVVDGKIVYTTTLTGTVEAYICNGPLRVAKSRIPLFFIPGEECVIDRKGTSYYVSGSKFYTQMSNADKAVEPYQRAYLDYSAEAQDKLDAAVEGKDELRKTIEAEFQEKYKAYKDAALNYLKSHNNESGAIALLINTLTIDEIMSTVTDEVKNGPMKPVLDFEVAYEQKRKAQEEALAEARKNVQPGMPAKEFTLNDIQGNPLSLSSLRGKYLVLDFWGSWCTWCIKGMPKMKEYYAKYAGKFEILGIDCNDSDTAWKNAVKKHELPWKHVYNPRNGSTLLNDYAIEGFPTKIVLDPEGKIARVIVGEDPTFYDYLDELMK